MQSPMIAEPTISDLNRKIDILTEQVAFLTKEAQEERWRRREREELKNDLMPLAGDMYRVTVRELAEIDGYFETEDLLRLLKRLLRNTRNLEQILDQMESFSALWQDMSPMTQDAFMTLLTRLESAEQKGYFIFLRGGLDITEKIVSSFDEDDLNQLGDNIVLILQTIKELTQPEIMTLLSTTAETLREEAPAADPSILSILRQLNDPAVKRGLSKTLAVLGSVSDA